jgi:hypothetical protein
MTTLPGGFGGHQRAGDGAGIGVIDAATGKGADDQHLGFCKCEFH